MTLTDILEIEKDRKEEKNWDIVHLFKTGGFWSAYEWSAWLVAVVSFNDEVRMQTKDRKPLTVSRYAISNGNDNDTFCKVGFPLKSVEKFIPNRIALLANDAKHIAIRIPIPPATPDGEPISYDYLCTAINDWRNSQQIKERGGKKNKNTAPVSQQSPHPIAQTPGGIISKILAYPLDQRTAADNMQFISELKLQITSIL
jgi:hypothetical protein